MTTILLWFFGVAIFLAILLSMPLTKHITQPFVEAMLKLVGIFFEHSASYFIWMLKSVAIAHLTLIQHLAFSKSHFDIANDVKGAQK